MSDVVVASDDDNNTNLIMMVATGVATVILTIALAYFKSQKSVIKGDGMNGQHSNGVDAKKDERHYPGGEITVYYGTQTGTAEAYARQIEREGSEHGFKIHVVDVETIDDVSTIMKKNNGEEEEDGETKTEEPTEQQEEKKRVIVLCSTYGEGEPPDNAVTFSNDLKQKASMDILYTLHPTRDIEPDNPKLFEDIEYCIFGLGNRQYDHFNAMAKFLNRAFEKLGAIQILDIELGDDEEDLDDEFENWKNNKLWPTLEEKYLSKHELEVKRENSIQNNGETLLLPPPECPFDIVYHTTGMNGNASNGHSNGHSNGNNANDKIHSSSKHYFTAVDCPVTVVRELQSPKSKHGLTKHVEIDITNAAGGFDYCTADNLGVLPINETSKVVSMGKSLKVNLDDVFTMQPKSGHEWHGIMFPQPCTIRECLTRYCDLTAAPRRADLKLLASYATDPLDQKALVRMSTKDGKEEYTEKIIKGYMGLVDLFQFCPSITMSWGDFLNICPSLQTRFFTISSSSNVHPKSIHLTVAVTQDTRTDGTMFKGVCSNYLADIPSSGVEMVRVYNRPSSFRLPVDTNIPIIMIGPGTGIAPMRAMLQEREYQKNVLKKKHIGHNILYFGCKTKVDDYIYKDELHDFEKKHIITKLRVAFSREQQNKKVYVQDLLQQHSKETWNYIHDKNAYVYVCGAVKMGHDVSETLKQICMKHGKMHENDAKAFLQKLSQDGRYVQELWES